MPVNPVRPALTANRMTSFLYAHPLRMERCTRYSPSNAAAGAVAGLQKHAAAAATPARPYRPAVNAQSVTANPSTAGVCVHMARLAVDHTDVAKPYAIAAIIAMRVASSA